MEEQTIIIWKFLLGGGLLGFFLSSALIVVILHWIAPVFQVGRTYSLRDQQIEQVPRFGGIALFWGFVGSLLILWWFPLKEYGLDLYELPQNRILGLCIGGFLIWGIGFADDLFNLHPFWKLTGQTGIAILVIWLGTDLHTVQIPYFQYIRLGLWSWPVTILWIVGIMNAINMIDGLDGLASGLTIVALACLASFCWGQDQYALLLLILILLGTTLGFWTFNRPPASIFMGDSGSLFLGFSLAILSIWSTETPNTGQSMLPMLILAIPIIDTVFAVFRRFFKGIPFYSADNDHLHHRLIAKGFSPSQAMALLVFTSSLFGGLALMAHLLIHFQGFAYLGGLILAYVLLYWLGYDVVRRPYISLLEQNDHSKRRNLMLALGGDIDSFFAKDPNRESIFRSFGYWTELAGVSRLEVRLMDSAIWHTGSDDLAHRTLEFHQDDWEVRIALPETSWMIDSDVKSQMLEQVSSALMTRLEQLG
jgi:UDP-GlcNAc:undecaprenyl-phosphate/decaprenyl-phosphate GlcNAc-1-phosphate transferase